MVNVVHAPRLNGHPLQSDSPRICDDYEVIIAAKPENSLPLFNASVGVHHLKKIMQINAKLAKRSYCPKKLNKCAFCHTKNLFNFVTYEPCHEEPQSLESLGLLTGGSPLHTVLSVASPLRKRFLHSRSSESTSMASHSSKWAWVLPSRIFSLHLSTLALRMILRSLCCARQVAHLLRLFCI